MSFQQLKPMLRTWDLAGSVAFYCEVLGFECVARNDEWGWAHVRREAAEIMLSGPNEHEGDKAPAFTGSLYITCDDVDAVWGAVSGRAKVCYPIESFEYGMREFGIYDNNGYLLQFGTVIAEVG